MAYLVISVQSLSLGCSQAVGWSSSHLELKDPFPDSLIWLLAGVRSSLAVGCGPLFLVMWAFPQPECPHDMAAGFPTESNLRERKRERTNR